MTDISEDELKNWAQTASDAYEGGWCDEEEHARFIRTLAEATRRLIAAYREQVRDKDTLLYTIDAASKIEAERDALAKYVVALRDRVDELAGAITGDGQRVFYWCCRADFEHVGDPHHEDCFLQGRGGIADLLAQPAPEAVARIEARLANLQRIESHPAALIEQLAAIEHERWAHWQSYMHSKAERRPDGALVLPPEIVGHWERQIAVGYSDLSEAEKASDREQVLRYLPVVEAAYQARLAAGDALALELEDAIAILRGHDERDSVLEDYRNALAEHERAKEGA